MESQTMANAVAVLESPPERSQAYRGRGRMWTAEEDRTLLWLIDQVKESSEPGTITNALEEAANALGRTPVAVRARYYRLAGEDGKKKRTRGRKKPKQSSEAFLENLAGFLSGAKSVDMDIAGFAKGLHHLTSLAAMAEQTPSLKEELDSVRSERDTLEAKVQEYEGQLNEVREQYETLDYLVKEFINLGSVDKVTSLGDFGRRLRYEVDQFGSVIKVERI